MLPNCSCNYTYFQGSGYLAGPGQIVPRGYSARSSQIVPRDYSAGSAMLFKSTYMYRLFDRAKISYAKLFKDFIIQPD